MSSWNGASLTEIWWWWSKKWKGVCLKRKGVPASPVPSVLSTMPCSVSNRSKVGVETKSGSVEAIQQLSLNRPVWWQITLKQMKAFQLTCKQLTFGSTVGLSLGFFKIFSIEMSTYCFSFLQNPIADRCLLITFCVYWKNSIPIPLWKLIGQPVFSNGTK